MSLYSVREYTQREEATGVTNSGVNSEEQGRDSGGKSQNDGGTNDLDSSLDKGQKLLEEAQRNNVLIE